MVGRAGMDVEAPPQAGVQEAPLQLAVTPGRVAEVARLLLQTEQ